MVVLSPRFAVLACLCAALPLAFPPPVNAAHLYGSHMHASSSRSHHRSPSASQTHAYDGKHDGHHKVPHRRVPELPPLLRRHGLHDSMNAQGSHSYSPHDHAHPPKGPQSVFARSRYRSEPGSLGHRSSVYVSGDHGDRYLVTRMPPNNRGNGIKGKERKSSHAYNRRQLEESNMVLGRIDIMGAAQSANVTQRLASLTVESTPMDWTSGQSTSKAFSLNASTTNQTQFIMMPMDESANSEGSFMKQVTLATEVFDASSAEMVMYCATYNPDPGSTSALLMTPCTGETQPAASTNDAAGPCSDSASDASSSDAHQSQIFSYDPSTGKVEPISALAGSAAVDNTSDDPTNCAGARVRRDISNSTMSVSTTASSTSTSTAPIASASQQARNVTLVYVPGALEVPASSPSALNSTSASMGQAPLFTTTITTTVMATVTAANPSTRTVTPAQAAVSASVSSVPSLSKTATMTASVPAASSLPSSMSSSLPITAPKAPANANESLQVEIVGVVPSTTSSSASTSTSTRTASTTGTTTTTSSSSSVSPTLNPEAKAWSIANQMAQRRI